MERGMNVNRRSERPTTKLDMRWRSVLDTIDYDINERSRRVLLWHAEGLSFAAISRLLGVNRARAAALYYAAVEKVNRRSTSRRNRLELGL